MATVAIERQEGARAVCCAPGVAAIVFALVTAWGVSSAAAAPKPTITIAPNQLVGDGKRVVELELEVADAENLGKRIRVKASRGKILSVSPISNGKSVIRFRPPRVERAQEITLTVSLHVYRKRLREKIRLTLLPVGQTEEVLASGEPDEDAANGALPEGAAPPLVPPSKDSTYLLAGIGSFGVEAETASLMEELLNSELVKMLDERLKDRSLLTKEMRAEVYACGGGPECHAKAARHLGSDYVVVGVVAQVGDAYNLNLALIDATSGTRVNKAQATLSGERALMLEAMQILVFELIDPSMLKGSLAMDIDLGGIAVFIDGKQVATTPLDGPITGLAPGEHALKLSSPTTQDYFNFFTIYHNKTTTLTVDPKEVAAMQMQLAAVKELTEVPLHRRWWFWTVVGGVVVAAVAGGAVYAVAGADEAGGLPNTTLGTINH